MKRKIICIIATLAIIALSLSISKATAIVPLEYVGVVDYNNCDVFTCYYSPVSGLQVQMGVTNVYYGTTLAETIQIGTDPTHGGSWLETGWFQGIGPDSQYYFSPEMFVEWQTSGVYHFQPISPADIGSTHTFTLSVANGNGQVSIDGVSKLSNTALDFSTGRGAVFVESWDNALGFGFFSGFQQWVNNVQGAWPIVGHWNDNSHMYWINGEGPVMIGFVKGATSGCGHSCYYEVPPTDQSRLLGQQGPRPSDPPINPYFWPGAITVSAIAIAVSVRIVLWVKMRKPKHKLPIQRSIS